MERARLLTSYSQELRPIRGSLGVHIQRPTQSDPEKLRDRLVHFFPDDESDEAKKQLRSAETRFLEAVGQGGVTPYVAFKEVIRTTALAQKMDTLHASHGGIDYYIVNNFRYFDIRNEATVNPLFGPPEELSEALKTEAINAATRRKVQEIKRLMAKNETRHVNGIQAIEKLQITNGAGQGQDGELEKS